MQSIIRLKNIRTRLTVWLFLVAMLPFSIACTIIYFQRIEVIKTSEFQKLSTIRDLKVDNLQEWINERKGDVRIVSENKELKALGFMDMQESLKPENKHLLANAREMLSQFTQHYHSYSELFFINPQGKVIISTTPDNEGLDKNRFPYFTEPLRTGNLFIQDIYYSKELRKNAMTFSRPVLCLAHDGQQHTIGIVVTRIDLEQSLYSLLQKRSGMGDTGETLIVNKDGIALSELRWSDNAPLRLKIKAEPAVLAAMGKTGITETKDYRGEPILAAYTHIPDTGWGFVAKQDQKELYARMQELLRNMITILLISIAAVYLTAMVLARNFSKPVIEVTDTARKIRAGDLSVRSRVEGYDEFGVLAQTFNEMAESMEIQQKTERSISSLNEIMVAVTEPAAFCEQITERLLEITGSVFGAFYVLNPDKNKFEHIFSIGFDSEHLKALDAKIIEGAFSSACTTKKITYINEIPKDTVFTVNTIAGAALPRCMVTIPFVIRKKVSAVISLGTLDDYSKESLKILDQIQGGISTVLSNMLAGKETFKLAKELSGKNQELEAQTGELQAASEELQKQNDELEAQRVQVEEASKLKSEFLSNMSHELRTPLNSVMALSNVLKMQASHKLDPEEVGYLDVIERNGTRLLNLINDILDLAKIESGRMDVTPEVFSLSTMIENITDSTAPLAEKTGLELRLKIADDLPQIESDEKRLHQIVMNLVGNAVKFTQEGHVSVSVDMDGKKFHIKVKDTGIGIAKQDLPHIFDEFKQVDGSTSRSYEGTGLGLAIAHKAAGILGGDLTAESKLGQGSTFTLTLPTTWQGPVLKPESLPERSELEPDKKTVLVVDDEIESVNMTAGFLAREGYNTISATSGAEALRLAETHQPFAITLDLIMPEMDGWEVLQKLKKNPRTADIPVVVVSVSEDRQTGFALGAVGHVTKPVTSDGLISEINNVCKRPFFIMVADDSELDRNGMIGIIKQANMRAVAALDGSECLELLKDSIPDVLVLDLMMPELDGFEVLERLRRDPRTMALPVIVVTAKDLTEAEKTQLNRQVVSVLEKSNLSSQRLLQEIKKHLRKIEKHSVPKEVLKKPKGNRILVVEDNESAVIQIQKILERQGYRVDVAQGGKQAVDFVQHTIPDGIILDLMMPEVDGFEVLEKIRGSKATATIPVLILTAKDLTPKDFKRLSANNIQQLIQKGDVESKDLLLKVKMMLGGKPETKDEISGDAEKTLKPDMKQKEVSRRRVWKSLQGLPRVLVIEDNPDNMISIKAILKDRYKIMEATDGEQGLQITLKELPDLVLLDISLPGMDGYAVVKQIKSDEKAAPIPVIALTAHAMKGDRERIIAAGCDDYISKPINPAEILNKLEEFFKK